MKRVLVILMAAGAPMAASAAEMSAGDLLGFCNSSDALIRRTCSRYILGVVQGIDLATGMTKSRSIFCVPEDVSEDRMLLAYMGTANALRITYPKDMELPAAGVIAAAMIKAFPCSKR